jgi:hypothetical protein
MGVLVVDVSHEFRMPKTPEGMIFLILLLKVVQRPQKPFSGSYQI